MLPLPGPIPLGLVPLGPVLPALALPPPGVGLLGEVVPAPAPPGTLAAGPGFPGLALPTPLFPGPALPAPTDWAKTTCA